MGQYVAFVQFLPTAVGTEDEHIAILPPAGVSIFIKRIRYGTGQTQGDQPFRIRVKRASTAGSGGLTAAQTPIKIREDSPASVCTVLAKSSSGGRTPGTNAGLLLDCTMIHRSTFEWVARDWRDFFESGVNERIIVTIEAIGLNGSNNFLEVEWLE